jgi:UbiD family decarboxylase
VKCETVDLYVPATSEIVIEGFFRPNFLEQEGPFGEYPGYMGPRAMSYVMDITCITHRNNPIYQAFLSQMPPSESSHEEFEAKKGSRLIFIPVKMLVNDPSLRFA